MMGTQYFNRREKDALVLTAPTWGPQPTAVIPGILPFQPETDPPEWVSTFMSPGCQEALVLSKHWYGRLLTQNYPPPVAVTWLPASPLCALTRRGLMVSTPQADWCPMGRSWFWSIWVWCPQHAIGSSWRHQFSPPHAQWWRSKGTECCGHPAPHLLEGDR